MPSRTSWFASSTVKNSVSVSTPRSTASLATFSAGSIPNTGTPYSAKYCRR